MRAGGAGGGGGGGGRFPYPLENIEAHGENECKNH